MNTGHNFRLQVPLLSAANKRGETHAMLKTKSFPY